jgi:hypothetical protein
MFRRNLLFPFAIHKIKFVENVVCDREKAESMVELYESLWDVWP